MNQEFKKIKSEGVTRYILENGSGGASSGGTSSSAIASNPVAVGAVQRRKPGQNLINQEAKEKESPKPRNFVAKNAKMGGAGAHKDKKKEEKQGIVKHKKPFAEDITAGQTSMTDYKSTPEGADGGEEYNDEVGMADSNIHTIIRSAKELINTLEPMENMPEWAQEKLAQVKGMLVTVKDYIESQHEHGNIYYTDEDHSTASGGWGAESYAAYSNTNHGRGVMEEVDDLKSQFLAMLKDKGIKHRVAGSPEQEKQRTQDMMAQRAKDRANAPAPAAPSPQEIAQAKEKLAMLSKQFDPNYQYSDDHSFWTKQHALAQQIRSLEKFIARGEVGVGESAGEDALRAFLAKGGQIQKLPYKKPRKADKTDYGSKHIGGGGDKMKSSRTGMAAKTQGAKVVGVGQEESAPPGWKGTVKAMKKHKEIDNPFALAWSMKKKGYKSHKPNVGEDAYMESLFAQLEERAKK
jgi:hypothetical protein